MTTPPLPLPPADAHCAHTASAVRAAIDSVLKGGDAVELARLPRLPRRDAAAHKGTFGTVAVIGGSAGDLLDAHGGRGPVMLGAPALSALAALRAGTGLVRIGTPAPLLHAALLLCPGATGLSLSTDQDGWYEPHVAAAFIDRAVGSCDALAIGPGLGTSPGACAAVLRAIQQDRVPVVLDADALNCFQQIPEFFRDFHAPGILTPHPGEFKRLVAALGLKGDLGLPTAHDAPGAPRARGAAAEQLAQRLGRIVVLKGHQTVVTDGQRTWTCPAGIGHPCLATAGSGDVLTGIIASLIAQFVGPTVHASIARLSPQIAAQMARPANKPLDLFEAACVGVCIHALAGSVWAHLAGCDGGMLATDLCGLVPACVQAFRQ